MLAEGKTQPSPRRMLARRRRWVRQCCRPPTLPSDSGISASQYALWVRSPPSDLSVPGEYRRLLSLREIAWMGVLGRRAGRSWGGAYFILLRPGVARLSPRGDGSFPPPEAVLLALKSEPAIVQEWPQDGRAGDAGSACDASWHIDGDAQVRDGSRRWRLVESSPAPSHAPPPHDHAAPLRQSRQVLDRSSMAQPCRLALRPGGGRDELLLNAASLEEKSRLMRALQEAAQKVKTRVEMHRSLSDFLGHAHCPWLA